MDDILQFIYNNFDWYFVIMILLGNYFIFNMVTYPNKIISYKRSKVYLTIIHSIIIGLVYHYIESSTPIKILINSFLLSTSIYEMGLKEIMDYLKENGSSIIINKIKSNTNNSQG